MHEGLLLTGKYRVGRRLGGGGMGEVWLATNELTGRRFAVKVLRPTASDPDGVARFFQEARVAGQLRHPGLVEVFDIGNAPELGGAPFLVMEELEGASLDRVIAGLGRLPFRMALEVVAAAARALTVAHAHGVVHRDLKPANIFLHRPGTGAVAVKVLDFGISKVRAHANDVALTQTGAMIGSPLYMSPEQMASSKHVDPRSDVHALGVVLWECLVGRPPFSGATYNLIVADVLRGPRPHLREAWIATMGSDVVGPEIGRIDAVVARAFAVDPAARFASAGELADVLEAELALAGGPMLGARGSADDLFGRLAANGVLSPPTVQELASAATRPATSPSSAAELARTEHATPGRGTPGHVMHGATPLAVGGAGFAATPYTVEPPTPYVAAGPPRPAPPEPKKRKWAFGITLGTVFIGISAVGALLLFVRFAGQRVSSAGTAAEGALSPSDESPVAATPVATEPPTVAAAAPPAAEARAVEPAKVAQGSGDAPVTRGAQKGALSGGKNAALVADAKPSASSSSTPVAAAPAAAPSAPATTTPAHRSQTPSLPARR